ncbi:MAG: tRNA dihydrouridine synthase DusB [Proteobacteria bacterium]|nr:tRNA dihydrouridine synthase DusB [Pseudomonadota bacterium]
MTGIAPFLSPLTIAGQALPGRALLAPMSGVTDHAFRQIADRFGAGMVVSEMVAADQLAAGDEEARLRAEGAGLPRHVVQLAGCEAGAMAEGARVAEASGADMIDINMGCPAKRVTSGWSGSALMRDLDHAQGLIAAVRAAVKVPVTLKMRLGWDHASLNAPELARRAEDNGLAMVIVHGRTRMQFYKGSADWGAVRAVRAATRLPLIVNGDIDSLGKAREALALSGADGVMVGRAALGRPWLVGEIAAGLDGRGEMSPSAQAMTDSALAHYRALVEAMGPGQGVRHARKHVAAYAEEARRRGFVQDRAELVMILECPDARRVEVFLASLFASRAADPDDLAA